MRPPTRRVLVALYPASWRARHAERFGALLEQTSATPAAVLDVVVHAGREHLAARPVRLRLLGAAVAFAVLDAAAVRLGVTDNILWAPTDPARAVALAVTLAPFAGVAAFGVRRRTLTA